MKNLKKLVIASFMLVIAFVAVVSSTYAWFTQGKDATVNTISIGVVDANKSILISKDNANWARELDFAYDGKITPVTLQATPSGNNFTTPVFKQIVWDDQLVPSYANSIAVVDNTVANYAQYELATSYSVDAKYYERSGDAEPYTYTAVAANTVNAQNYGTYYTNKADLAGYIRMELYFQISVAKENEWGTTSLNMDLSGVHAYNFTGANNTVNLQDENDEAVSSFRCAVVYGGNIMTILQSTTGSGTYGEGDQFDPQSGWMKKMADATQTADHKFVSQASANADYELLAGVKQDVYDLEDEIDDSTQGATSDPVFEYTLSFDQDDTIAADITSLDADCVYISTDGLTRTYHLTLYVWMEGWDGDNTNAAAKCQYQFDLSFRAQ